MSMGIEVTRMESKADGSIEHMRDAVIEAFNKASAANGSVILTTDTDEQISVISAASSTTMTSMLISQLSVLGLRTPRLDEVIDPSLPEEDKLLLRAVIASSHLMNNVIGKLTPGVKEQGIMILLLSLCNVIRNSSDANFKAFITEKMAEEALAIANAIAPENAMADESATSTNTTTH